jgi:hypothetical protein
MTTYRITAPVAGYTGAVGAIDFAKGVAYVSDTTNSGALEYFRGQGYAVEDVDGLEEGEAGSAGGAAQVDDLKARIVELEAELEAAKAPAKTTGSTAGKGAQK